VCASRLQYDIQKHDMLTVLVWVILDAALAILGFLLMRPDFGQGVWWVVMGVGVALVIGIVSVVLSMRQDVHLDCHHCGGNVIQRMKSSTSHLYLTTGDEIATSCLEGETKPSEKREAWPRLSGLPGRAG
jgi:hypothetical protein